MNQLRPRVRRVLALALLSGVFALTGCGVKSTSSGSGNEIPPGNGGSATTTPILLTLTGEPASTSIVSFYANIAQVQITPRTGSSFTLYSSANTQELTHLARSSQYLVMTGLPQDSYTKMTVTVTDPLVTYIDATGATVTTELPTYTGTAEIDFSDLLTVDATPLEIKLDFDLQKSVTLDPKAGTLALTPAFTSSALPLIPTAPSVGTGKLETVLGTVSSYTASVLTLNTNVAQTNLSCNITSSTVPVNYSASAGLSKGSLVRVDMVAQRDSSISCSRIEAVNTSNVGYAFSGIVNSYRGLHAPYQMTLAMQDGSGAGVSPTFIAQGINANFDTTTTWAIDWDGISQLNLDFTPEFSVLRFFPGQSVEASSAVPLLTTGNDVGAVAGSMTTVAAMNATQLTLRKQQEEGSVSQVSANANGVTSFLLTLDPASVFAQYTADPTATTAVAPTITVVVPAGSTIDGSLTTTLTGAPKGSAPYVKVRGLLFKSGSAFILVAQRVTATLPPTTATTTTTGASIAARAN